MLYDINTKQINEQLVFLEKCLDICEMPTTNQNPMVYSFALARAIHMAVESITEIGSIMINGFFMRDPGGYKDIIDILEDEQVFSPSLALEIQHWVKLRKRLVRRYTEVTDEELQAVAKTAPILRSVIPNVQQYIEQELA